MTSVCCTATEMMMYDDDDDDRAEVQGRYSSLPIQFRNEIYSPRHIAQPTIEIICMTKPCMNAALCQPLRYFNLTSNKIPPSLDSNSATKLPSIHHASLFPLRPPYRLYRRLRQSRPPRNLLPPRPRPPSDKPRPRGPRRHNPNINHNPALLGRSPHHKMRLDR